ncbi:MAG: hypothetical protein WC489_01050 [Patescibacteria group bacterium]
MIFRLDSFFFDERDIFTLLFGLFLTASFIFAFPLDPFRRESLVVLFLFMLVTRSTVSQMRYSGYILITLLGLLFSLFLSPYGTAIYLLIAMFIYTRKL